jgi:hypothetical protein
MAIDGQKVAEPNSTKPRDMSTRIFLGFLGFIAAMYAVVLVYHTTNPPDAWLRTADCWSSVVRSVCSMALFPRVIFGMTQKRICTLLRSDD